MVVASSLYLILAYESFHRNALLLESGENLYVASICQPGLFSRGRHGHFGLGSGVRQQGGNSGQGFLCLPTLQGSWSRARLQSRSHPWWRISHIPVA